MDKIYSRKRLIIPKVNKINRGNYNIDTNNISQKKLLKTLLVVVIAVCIANKIINELNPLIDVLCVDMAKGIATKISNEQATIVMVKYEYSDITQIIKDENGKIQMIKMNSNVINEITSDIALYIQNAINESDSSKFYIKLGTFSGTKILSGRGPAVEIKMSTAGNVETDLVSQFSQAGVNQTLHRIYLNVKCNVIILTPFNTIQDSITNQILLSEAVIVGEVPENYYNLNGLDKNDLVQFIE